MSVSTIKMSENYLLTKQKIKYLHRRHLQKIKTFFFFSFYSTVEKQNKNEKTFLLPHRS